MKISVIISTYNAEAWLEKVLWGYNQQTFKEFELVIADDGSRETTRQLVSKIQAEVNFPIQYIWHEDNGFQKSTILNKAITACKSDYILMSDGDCIPRKDFVEMHMKYRKPGHFISGGYYMLPMNISELIKKDDIISQRCFDIDWLLSHGLKKSFKNNKLSSKGFKAHLLNAVTPTKASWNGHNSSGWKADILAVNGFDERMQYGGQDRELGERLMNLGIKGIQKRYSAICIHLDHKRGYKTEDSIAKNRAIRKTTKEGKIIYTPYGIKKEVEI